MSLEPVNKPEIAPKKKKKRVERTVNPHRHTLPMDEVPIDLGVELERRIDTRTNALLMGLDGGVGPGIDSGSDLNSIRPGDTDETEYEPITDNNFLTQTSYINAIFQDSSVLHEDEVTADQHRHQKRTISNRLETDSIEHIPANRREGEPAPIPRPKKNKAKSDEALSKEADASPV